MHHREDTHLVLLRLQIRHSDAPLQIFLIFLLQLPVFGVLVVLPPKLLRGGDLLLVKLGTIPLKNCACGAILNVVNDPHSVNVAPQMLKQPDKVFPLGSPTAD